jgi:molecular chaperone GrpE
MDQSTDIVQEPLEPQPLASDAAQSEQDRSSCLSCEEYMAGWKRAQADYQNLKREVDKERSEMAKYANERLLSDLLPAIDQFGIALRFTPDTSHLPEDQKKIWDNWLVGVRAVQSLWDRVGGDVGLERISTDGAFDPSLHDAAGEEVVEGKDPGAIVKVLQDGWRFHGKVLRPARVIVAK